MMAKDASSSADSEEIKEIASSMEQDFGYLKWPEGNIGAMSSSCQIHRVHPLVRQIDRFAYEPFVLSIGPYHHRKVNLQYMEKLKWSYLDYVLKLNCTKSIRDYLVAMKNVENHARACYCGEFNLDSKSFQRMLLLDGCFILVYLTGAHGLQRIDKTDPGHSINNPDDNVSGTGYAAHQANRSSANSGKQKLENVHDIELEITDAGQQSSGNKNLSSCHESSSIEWYDIFALLDLFLLENQIPFVVVEKIHEVLVGSDMKNKLKENVSNYIEENLQYFTGAFGIYERPNDFYHLLHLCHMHFKPRMFEEESSHPRHRFGEYFLDIFCKLFHITRRHKKDEWNSWHNQQSNFLHGGQVTRWHRATQYHEAGIVFKRKEFGGQSAHSLLDISFHDGVLEIPCLSVDDRTCSLFRNMVAFEQTSPQFGNSITAYVMFMSQIISRPDDVSLLSQRGIIVHLLHSDKVVSALFTQLTKGVVFDFTGNFYLRSICWKMEMYYRSRLNRWIAWIRHNHLSNPWLGVALLAGLLVVFCTIAQTVLTVLTYVGPP
ncbi:unnamed protein product [Urochloa decumbens]|uniref:Uncharacterized protein n=1 Tax=Urochloa decumbens TaxID=240449 RepID=A0ABC9DFS3_9POAL